MTRKVSFGMLSLDGNLQDQVASSKRETTRLEFQNNELEKQMMALERGGESRCGVWGERNVYPIHVYCTGESRCGVWGERNVYPIHVYCTGESRCGVWGERNIYPIHYVLDYN